MKVARSDMIARLQAAIDPEGHKEILEKKLDETVKEVSRVLIETELIEESPTLDKELRDKRVEEAYRYLEELDWRYITLKDALKELEANKRKLPGLNRADRRRAKKAGLKAGLEEEQQ